MRRSLCCLVAVSTGMVSAACTPVLIENEPAGQPAHVDDFVGVWTTDGEPLGLVSAGTIMTLTMSSVGTLELKAGLPGAPIGPLTETITVRDLQGTLVGWGHQSRQVARVELQDESTLYVEPLDHDRVWSDRESNMIDGAHVGDSRDRALVLSGDSEAVADYLSSSGVYSPTRGVTWTRESGRMGAGGGVPALSRSQVNGARLAAIVVVAVGMATAVSIVLRRRANQ